MQNNITITAKRLTDDTWFVEIVSPTGYKSGQRCDNEEQAVSYANGVRDGMLFARSCAPYVEAVTVKL